MALLGCSLGDVVLGLIAFQADGERLTGFDTIQGETGPDESHGAEIGGYIELDIGPLLGPVMQRGANCMVSFRHGLTDLTICMFTIAARSGSDVYVENP